MKLDAVVQDPKALLEMERYVDGGAKSYSALAARTEAAPRYRRRAPQLRSSLSR